MDVINFFLDMSLIQRIALTALFLFFMWAVGHMFHSSTDSKLHNIADAIDHLSDITSSIDNLKNEVVKLRLELNNLKKGE